APKTIQLEVLPCAEELCLADQPVSHRCLRDLGLWRQIDHGIGPQDQPVGACPYGGKYSVTRVVAANEQLIPRCFKTTAAGSHFIRAQIMKKEPFPSSKIVTLKHSVNSIDGR